LGKAEEHTVYELEIVGVVLAVQLLKEAGQAKEAATMALGVDNQAATRMTDSVQS
jgi:hypothetical protein